MKKTSTNKILKKKTQTVITDNGSQDISRRELLIKAGRIVAGTVGGFALISMANINSVFGQDEATRKSIRKALPKDLKEEDVKTILASQQSAANDQACNCYECGFLPCDCSIHSNDDVKSTNIHIAVQKQVDHYAQIPAVPGMGLGILALGLGLAGAWRILKDRAAEADKT
ncbi:MAG: hypothetical protein ABSH11_11020 [Verrucomicrobiota bacterium]